MSYSIKSRVNGRQITYWHLQFPYLFLKNCFIISFLQHFPISCSVRANTWLYSEQLRCEDNPGIFYYPPFDVFACDSSLELPSFSSPCTIAAPLSHSFVMLFVKRVNLITRSAPAKIRGKLLVTKTLACKGCYNGYGTAIISREGNAVFSWDSTWCYSHFVFCGFNYGVFHVELCLALCYRIVGFSVLFSIVIALLEEESWSMCFSCICLVVFHVFCAFFISSLCQTLAASIIFSQTRNKYMVVNNSSTVLYLLVNLAIHLAKALRI